VKHVYRWNERTVTRITLEIVKAGLHCSLRISRHMLPLLLILGWKTFVLKDTYNESIIIMIKMEEACTK
jgi:hypothetical protein